MFYRRLAYLSKPDGRDGCCCCCCCDGCVGCTRWVPCAKPMPKLPMAIPPPLPLVFIMLFMLARLPILVVPMPGRCVPFMPLLVPIPVPVPVPSPLAPMPLVLPAPGGGAKLKLDMGDAVVVVVSAGRGSE